MKKHKVDLSKHLTKPDESISFRNNEVVKYFANKNIVEARVERAQILGDLVPKIIKSTPNTYTYKYIEGELISKLSDRKIFERFLNFCERRLWKKKKLTPKAKKEFLEKTKKFYYDKTINRLEKFYRETGIKDKEEIINGVKIPKLNSLLKKIDWQWLCKGIPVLFHGDLQPENILVTKNSFKLLDWRHEFEGLREYGDIYYDFVKLYHALPVSHEIIRKEEYKIKQTKNGAEFEFYIKSNLMELKEVFDSWATRKGYDLKKIEVLSALVYLNIAPLHHYPYNLFLYYLGKKNLYESLRTH